MTHFAPHAMPAARLPYRSLSAQSRHRATRALLQRGCRPQLAAAGPRLLELVWAAWLSTPLRLPLAMALLRCSHP